MSRPEQPMLTRFRPGDSHKFQIPIKQINEGTDLSKFLASRGYHDIVSFIAILNRSMFPVKASNSKTPIAFELPENPREASHSTSPTISGLQRLIEAFDQAVSEAPPDPGPRRFGNISFRRWFGLVEDRVDGLMREHLPAQVIGFAHSTEVDAVAELRAYLLGAWGSAQRLDYGTGHELSFLAFLGGLWKLGGFSEAAATTTINDSASSPQSLREIVLGVIQPYLVLVRKLILTYNLEPAGTHGVWGLDDHSFAPYLFGSAQYGPPIDDTDPTPTEGSLVGSPDPGDVVKKERVAELRRQNLYFGAIGFIYDVKKGPFWEHSPTLYDISGVTAGWGKINKGMVKMYNAEVLSKFPVVQHFPFGSLFSWDRSPDAVDRALDVHGKSQPQKVQNRDVQASKVPGPIDVTSTMQGAQAGLTRAPWAQPAARSTPAQRLPPPTAFPAGPGAARQLPRGPSTGMPQGSGTSGNATRLPAMKEDDGDPMQQTKAPWAK